MQGIVSDLPKTLTAAVFVVMHIPPWSRSRLADILGRHTKLPVFNPGSQVPVEPGRIYVAPPDYHLLIERDKRIGLWHGPKENNFRPAINTLFRSAADVYGNRVIGVLLTGSLDEGVAGLAWIKRHHGITVVQDPNGAKFPQLPNNALRHVAIDFIRPVPEIAGLLLDLVKGSEPEATTNPERRT